MTTWGLVATIKAPVPDILQFAAFHLDAGAQQLHIYLDDANTEAAARLRPHPKVKVTLCDAAYWNGKRPKKHQVRQTANATHAYGLETGVDWLAHIDVDEFLVSDQPVADVLATIPQDTVLTRIRPMELLAGSTDTFKAFIPNGPDRAKIVNDIYPTFGRYLKGGFLSHVAGKILLRTGMDAIHLRIHNAFQHDRMLTGTDPQPGIDLAHCHAPSWDAWQSTFDYRLEKGAYRADLAPASKGVMTAHDVFQSILKAEGPAGLRAVFDEVCANTPDLQARLQKHGLLRHANLALNTSVKRHFPD